MEIPAFAGMTGDGNIPYVQVVNKGYLGLLFFVSRYSMKLSFQTTILLAQVNFRTTKIFQTLGVNTPPTPYLVVIKFAVMQFLTKVFLSDEPPFELTAASTRVKT